MLTELVYLVQTALRLAPRQLWLLSLGTLVAVLNLACQQEIWPNTPGAGRFFALLLLLCGLPLPWLLARTAQLMGRQVRGWFWRLCFSMAGVFGYIGALFSSLVGVGGIVYIVARILE